MVDWKVAAVIAVLIGLGCFIARLGLVDMPKPFEAYDREGALYVKRGKELFRVVGIRDEYSVEKRGRRASCREGRLRRAGENDIIPSVGKMAVNSYDW